MQSNEITKQIIKSFYTVYNSLGYGFLEKVYENSMILELTRQGLNASGQKKVNVFYQGQIVGEYFADIIVNDSVIIELKAIQELSQAHEAQLINYLRATRIELGLLLNFGPKPEIRRKIFDRR
ncbi:MAG: GxxExxY protein [Calditrichaeota bacterium]|nr:GxxExxY protein [Calditrichota bacterium]